MNTMRRHTTAVRLAAAAIAVLVGSGALVGQARDAEKMRLKKKELGDLQQLHVFDDIYLAGQPSPDDLTRLKAAGVKTIISLRHDKELSWNEAAAVERNGMDFVHVPFAGAQQFKPAIFDQVLTILRDKKRRPVMLHCGSANRVGAIWYAYRVLDGKLSPDAAMKEAKTVGLRTPAYRERAQEYVEQTRKAESQTSSSDQ